jgi:hypothetical protein
MVSLYGKPWEIFISRSFNVLFSASIFSFWNYFIYYKLDNYLPISIRELSTFGGKTDGKFLKKWRYVIAE